MSEYLEEAREELKRVDHIIYVSLKYTRTVDVIRNALLRMVSACDYMIEGILDFNIQKKKIKEIPKTPIQRIELVKQLHKDDTDLHKFIRFYVFLRELVKAPYTRREEYRRHVTMIAQLKNQTAEIDIDILEDNFDNVAKDFLEYVEILVGLKEPEE
jgi:hypothetical protein